MRTMAENMSEIKKKKENEKLEAASKFMRFQRKEREQELFPCEDPQCLKTEF